MKQKVLNNLLWRFGERTIAQLISFFVTIVIARLLNPKDYGDVALITVMISILQILVDGGFGNALIQKKDSDEVDFSSVFYFNIILCCFLYFIIYYIAPCLGDFYNNSEMISMIRVLGIIVIVSGIKNIQQAYISKTLQFKKFFYSTLFGTIISGIVGIIFALKGFGAWALIAQYLTNSIVDTIVVWFSVEWRPKRIFSFYKLRKLFSFGWKLLLSNLIDAIYGNIRQLLIAKMYTSSDLAFYNRGNYIPNIIVVNINASIDSVLFPVMSSKQENKEILKEMAKKSIKVSNYIMAPLMMGIASMAESIVEILLTEKWLPCVPFVRIFCIIYMFQPIQTVNANIIKAVGRSDIRLKQEIITKLIGILLLFVSLKQGVLGIAYAYLFGNFINQYVNSYPCKEIINYSYFRQVLDILPSTLLAICMGIVVNLVYFINIPLVIQVILQVIVGFCIYVLGSILLRIDSFYMILNMLKGLVNWNEYKKKNI